MKLSAPAWIKYFFYCLAVETDDSELFSNKLSNKLFVCGLINDNYPPLWLADSRTRARGGHVWDRI